jgi:lipoprotein-releasing system ATP-binding protein
MTDSVLKVQGLCRHFNDGDRRVDVLKNVDLQVARAETVAIIGSSGSGKSTLLHCLGLLDRPDAGEIFIQDVAVSSLGETARSALRNKHLGFVYQFHHLLGEFDALDNVAMPLIVRGLSLADARAQAEPLLQAMGLGARASHFPGQLSGGERQRVALARALVTKPICVLADEPTGNLDRETAQQVFELIANVRDQFGTALVLVTHDLTLASKADRQLTMVDGHLAPLVTDKSPNDISPQTNSGR